MNHSKVLIKKTLLLTTFLSFIFNYSFGQKLYVWCPDEQNVKPRIGFLENQEINILVFDGRTITKNSKVECESENVVQALSNYIRKAYPSAKINLLKNEAYYKKPEKGKITIKLAISAYHAGFGADISAGIGSVGGNFSYGVIPKGEWNGVTSYYVQIFDSRNEDKKLVKEISEIASKPNMWGYKTAKVCLNTTYIQANQTLLFFIDNSLME
jgi:hypothetical protein